MSGRSAIIRKKQDKSAREHLEATRKKAQEESSGVGSISSGSDGVIRPPHLQNSHGLFAVSQKPSVPIVVDSLIEKSSFRKAMEEKSAGVRNNIVKALTSRKKTEAKTDRPATATEAHAIREPSHELDGHSIPPPPAYGKQNMEDGLRPGPPLTKLPPVPGEYKQWPGRGHSAQPWDKSSLRQDSTLWDPNGDLVVYVQESNDSTNQGILSIPSYKVKSSLLLTSSIGFLQHVIEGARRYVRKSAENPGWDDGCVKYEYTLLLPGKLQSPKTLQNEITHHLITCRNVFAVLLNCSLVAKSQNLTNALFEVYDLLYSWQEVGEAALLTVIHSYIVHMDFSDPRNNIALAIALFNWSERWHFEDLYCEAFVHLAGLYNKAQMFTEFKEVSRRSKIAVEGASIGLNERVTNAEALLKSLDFDELWKQDLPASPAREAYERLRKFFIKELEKIYGAWPPAIAVGEDIWLTREIALKLQADFGALYDYLVDRTIEWECVESRSGPKWGLIQHAIEFHGNTSDVPFTDLVRKWDDKHGCPHIPLPYPLLPESIAPVKGMKKSSKEGKNALRKFALAYDESTNAFLSRQKDSDNPFVESFLDFEKEDLPLGVDPQQARRGRWILIYVILQALATVSVDNPRVKHTNGVAYHLSAAIASKGPFFVSKDIVGAFHEDSHCWNLAKRSRLGSVSSMRSGPGHSYFPALTSLNSESEQSSQRGSESVTSSMNLGHGRFFNPASANRFVESPNQWRQGPESTASSKSPGPHRFGSVASRSYADSLDSYSPHPGRNSDNFAPEILPKSPRRVMMNARYGSDADFGRSGRIGEESHRYEQNTGYLEDTAQDRLMPKQRPRGDIRPGTRQEYRRPFIEEERSENGVGYASESGYHSGTHSPEPQFPYDATSQRSDSRSPTISSPRPHPTFTASPELLTGRFPAGESGMDRLKIGQNRAPPIRFYGGESEPSKDMEELQEEAASRNNDGSVYTRNGRNVRGVQNDAGIRMQRNGAASEDQAPLHNAAGSQRLNNLPYIDFDKPQNFTNGRIGSGSQWGSPILGNQNQKFHFVDSDDEGAE